MNAQIYIGFFYGNKEEAMAYLEKWIPIYEFSSNRNNTKVIKRISDYKKLLVEIKTMKDE